MENSARFIQTFVEIELALKSILNTNAYSFVKMVHMASTQNATIRRYRNDLLEYAQLRNAIIHNRSKDQRAIAEPHDDIVLNIEAILKELTEPKTIKDLKLDKVFSVEEDFLLDELSMIQEKYNYSVVPVYNKDRRYCGCVHARLYQKAFQFRNDGMKTVSDLLKFSNYKNRIIFVSENKNLRTLVYEFNQSYEAGKGVIAYLVSKNGSNNEHVISIITPADIPRIIKHLE